MGIKSKIIGRLKLWLDNYSSISSRKIEMNVHIQGSIIDKNVVIKNQSSIFFSQIGGKVLIGSKCSIQHSVIQGAISIKNNCKLYHCNLSGNINIGRYTSIWGPNLDLISDEQSIVIGNFCSIARNVSFQSFNHNHKKATTYFIGKNVFNETWQNEKKSKGNIIIENDVWIASHCVILGGVNIGNGAVVAANSVVTKTVPPYAIVAGSPAKIIGYRFSEERIVELLTMKWWDWSEEELLKNKVFFKEELKEA
ncbi:CatB-related O-acetyltransferase [Lacinutrix mariniflava]|uniref:xenobiotic acyltransferase family protein n=1 Tax=Lacinutrix mariniflava TaxID=342955 RepID=UPI0006E2D3B6|nr:CatB-related O-acetyltransferase [Lacinutrix mariniflava]